MNNRLLFFISTIFFSLLLVGCTNQSSEELKTEELILRVLRIYDTPQGEWNHTITACRIESECLYEEYVFNHENLPKIDVYEGMIVSVTVEKERIIPFPAPLQVLDWFIN